MIDFDKILNELEPVKDKVFILPLEREYLLKLSKKVGVEFPEIYLEFREKIGFTQDILPDLLQTEDSLVDDLDYTESWCNDFFPIGTFSTEEIDYTWLLEKKSENGQIYQVDIEEEENAKPEKTERTIQILIEEEIENIKKGKSNRLKNTEKVRLFEFRIQTKDFDEIIEVLSKIFNTEWIDNRWRDKYTPNVLGIEVAFFKLNEYQIIVQREKDLVDGKLSYFFEIEEMLTKVKNKSLAEEIKELFETENVKYKFTDYGIMVDDFEE